MDEYIKRSYLMGEITSSEAQTEIKQMDGCGVYNRVLEIVNSAPASDVAPVVRCKECKHGHESCGDIACWHPEYDLLEGVLTHEKDFFCAYGERKEGAE